jgi:hypothetical protein
MISLALAILTALPTPNLKFTAEVVGDQPLPSQAVRLRLTVENVGREPLPSLSQPEISVALVGRKREGDEQFEPVAMGYLRASTTRAAPPACVYIPYLHSRLVLKPGEKRTFTFPVAAVCDPRFASNPDSFFWEPLFPKPGAYVVCVRFSTSSDLPGKAPPGIEPGIQHERGYVYAEVNVVVGKPGEKDKPWVDALARDETLFRPLLGACSACSEEHAKAIAALLEKAPDSTYADYGRYAVARRLTLHAPKNLSEKDYEANWARGQDMLLSTSERPVSKQFPFLPSVRLSLRPAERERVEILMNRDFRDSVEWFHYVGPRRQDLDASGRPLPPKAKSEK